MEITGVIVEYNPFHQGHQYHMEMARSMTEAEGIVAVMSGDFVQRGQPAIVDKYRRTRMALAGGADVVLELPVHYATGSAEGFASGAVEILEQLGCVTNLVYGCECTDAELLARVAGVLSEEPERYRQQLQEALRNGMSYPAARSLAVEAVCPGTADVLAQPNNILAIEYQKAILRMGASLRPQGLTRRGDGYHTSARVIRQAMEQGETKILESYLPEFTRKELEYQIHADDFSTLLNYRLLMLTEEELIAYADVTPELAARIGEQRGKCLTFSELVDAVKSRNYTRTRVQRALLHILLGIFRERKPLPFVRVLGFRRGTEVLHRIKQGTKLPIITKMAQDKEDAWAMDRMASDVYNQIVWDKYRIRIPDEYHGGPVIWEG